MRCLTDSRKHSCVYSQDKKKTFSNQIVAYDTNTLLLLLIAILDNINLLLVNLSKTSYTKFVSLITCLIDCFNYSESFQETPLLLLVGHKNINNIQMITCLFKHLASATMSYFQYY